MTIPSYAQPTISSSRRFNSPSPAKKIYVKKLNSPNSRKSQTAKIHEGSNIFNEISHSNLKFNSLDRIGSYSKVKDGSSKKNLLNLFLNVEEKEDKKEFDYNDEFIDKKVKQHFQDPYFHPDENKENQPNDNEYKIKPVLKEKSLTTNSSPALRVRYEKDLKKENTAISSGVTGSLNSSESNESSYFPKRYLQSLFPTEKDSINGKQWHELVELLTTLFDSMMVSQDEETRCLMEIATDLQEVNIFNENIFENINDNINLMIEDPVQDYSKLDLIKIKDKINKRKISKEKLIVQKHMSTK